MRPTRSFRSLLALALVAACQTSPQKEMSAQKSTAGANLDTASVVSANEAPALPPGVTATATPTPNTNYNAPVTTSPPTDTTKPQEAKKDNKEATGRSAMADPKPSAKPTKDELDDLLGAKGDSPYPSAGKKAPSAGAGISAEAVMDPFIAPSKSKPKVVAGPGRPLPVTPTAPLVPMTPPPVIAPVKTEANANAFYENTYQGGSGGRDRIEDLIANGVMVDGKSIPLDALTADYRQPFPIPFDRALSLETATEFRALESKGGRTVLQVGLQGMQTETPRRPPLRLSLVIDVSGSMKKEDRMTKVQDALTMLVGKLTKEDEVSIVAFESTAKVLCQMGAANRPEVNEAIKDLIAGGGTNIYDGLQYGYSQLGLLPKGDEGFKVVLLFSDGEVTAGEQDPAKFEELTRSAFASKIATTTFGVGLSFNEELMMNISISGKGNYHFLKDAVAAEKAINGELEDYTHVVASDVLMRVKLASGVKLIRVYGANELDEGATAKVKADEEMLDDRARKDLGIAEDRTKDDEDGIKTLIPQFYLGDAHIVLMEVEVPAGTGVRPVADVFLKYKDTVFNRNGTEKESVTVETAPSSDAQIRSLDSSVKKNILGFETGETLVAAATFLRDGKTLEAAKKLDEQRELLSNAASSWVDDDLRRDSELVGKYQEVVASLGNRNMSNTDEGEALAKAFVFSGYQLKK
jgi:Mg-chelatase subunit ChlD